MESHRIDPLGDADLDAATEFLSAALKWDQADNTTTIAPPYRSRSEFLQSLHWRLLDNPARISELGLCLRSSEGMLLGILQYFPSWFVLGDQRWLGLGSGGFYVAPSARIQGFFMFRRYLRTPGVDFVFATTCNAASGQLFEKHGGEPVPGAHESFSLLLHAAAVAEEYALRGHARGVPPALARVAGHLATPLLRLGRRRAQIAFRTTTDWDRL